MASEPNAVPKRNGLTLRALILGLLLVLLISLGAPYSIWIVGSSEITWSVFPVGVGVPFVFLIFANALVKRLRNSWGLTPSDLVTVVAMGLVCSGIPVFVVGYVLAVISKPYYGATPENEWASFVQPYLPDWAIPGPDGQAMRYFYEGLPSGEPVPFGAWAGPLCWWLSLLMAIYLLCFCMVVVLRRQWVENERLIFPVTEVPRLLVEESPGSSLPSLLRSQVFWIGCSLPIGTILFNAISYFQPGFPQIPVHHETNLQLLGGTQPLVLVLYFPVLGFMYLVGTGISFSLWVFYLLTLAESGLISWAGFTVSRPDEFVWEWQTLSWQAYGAFFSMVLWGLWAGRRHLSTVGRHVFRRCDELPDSEEMMSYTWATRSGLVSLLYILVWMWRSGMDLHVAGLYLGALVVMFIGFTRLVIQAGLHYLTPPMTAQAFTLAVTGTAVAPHTSVALALSYSCFGDVESLFMPSVAHAAKLADLCPSRRGLAIAIGVAVVVGFAVSTYFILYLCYEYGAGNLRSWFFQSGAGAGGRAFDSAVRQLRDSWGPDWGKLTYFGFGGLIYSLLSFLQYRFYWWPLPPVGLTVATTWMVRRTVLSIFIAWIVKTTVLRLGGIRLYRQLRPFFIGLVVGFFIGVGLSYLIDAVWFFGKGHPILHG
jgi:hypothetical protein